jgi:formate dehydrogenase subunit beta
MALVSDAGKMAGTAPLLPAMATNAASTVRDLAKLPPDSADTRVAVVLRSCELRAAAELIKLRQILTDNLVLVGIDCPGTYKSAGFAQTRGDDADFDNNHARNQQEHYTNPDLRTACQVCEFPVPPVADIAIGFLGLDPDQGLWFEARTEKGEQLAEGLETEAGDEPEARTKYVAELVERRKKAATARIAEFDKVALGPENLARYFADCLNCHNCMRVCPVCYCHECFFDSDTFLRQLDEHVRISKRKGLTRMPSEMLLFHLTRMNHMMTSCVACGICEDSCPAGIGLLPLFKKVSRNAQAEFNYVAGRSLDEDLPLTTFREDEFKKVGEE